MCDRYSLANRRSLLAFAVAAFVVCRPGWAQPNLPAEKVVGRQVCKVCHTSEYAAWEHSSHNTKAWKLLDHPKAAGFAKALGITDIKGESACTKCHGTQQRRRGKLAIYEGNSCESCHGAAGGQNGWGAVHCDFGFGRRITRDAKMSEFLADRAKESEEHRKARLAACDKAGMNRSANALELAANCLQCHLVPNEKLIEAGHPMSSRFEFVEWSQGEVRHNFLLDRNVNAKAPTNWLDPELHGPGRTPESRKRLMFVAGQLADLAVSLKCRALSTSTRRGTLGDEANDRIRDIQDELEDLEIADLQPVLDLVADMDKRSLREVTPNDRQLYGKAAGKVAAAAKKFIEAHRDGTTLPDGIDVPDDRKGEPYEP